MTRSEAEGKLKLAMEHALRMSGAHTSALTLAGRVYDSERELMAVLRRPWMVDRMAKMLTIRVGKQVSPDQLPIPGMEDLPRRIPVPVKTRTRKIPLQDATLPQLLAYRKTLKRSAKLELKKVDQLIAVMRQYAGRSRKVTLGDLAEKYGQQIFEFATGASA